MFAKILIANRGEIACRVIQTARKMGIKTVAVYSSPDADALHVEMADEAVHIGPAPATQSYLNGASIIAAAIKTKAQAIHPGYGFLSENADFVEAVKAADLTFIGPSANAIRKMGRKDAAKVLMQKAGVPVVPGYHGDNQDPRFLAQEAKSIGYPVLIKARAGGGGKGMRLVESAKDFNTALKGAQREAQASFKDPHVLIEKYIAAPRHIEVQIFGDKFGNVIHLFERDCSLQRRHQKVIEEAPAPGMSDAMRTAMTDAAIQAAKAIGYEGAGTVEFIVDGSGPLRPDGFWFMEMNTRLQVEHPVTEAITGFDLVKWQLKVAHGQPLPRTQDQIKIKGHAVEARVYAEDASNDFLPASGKLQHLGFGDARTDTGVRQGDVITPWYDPLIAKIITFCETREGAFAKMRTTLATTHIAGTTTNVGLLAALFRHSELITGNVDTGLIERDLEKLMAPVNPHETAIALAAIPALGLDFAAPFAGWRLWGEASHRVSLTCQDEHLLRRAILHGGSSLSLIGGKADIRLDDIHCERTRIKARVDGHKVTGEIVTYQTSEGSRCVSVLFEGKTWLFSIPDPLAGHDVTQGDDNTITAPMTGVVRLVEAKSGTLVKAGDRLVVLEAMKMEYSLKAPRDGTIKEIHCEEDQAVDGGSVLLSLEDDGKE